MNEELRIRPHRLMEEKTKTVGIAQELKNVVGALDLSVATTSWQGTSHSHLMELWHKMGALSNEMAESFDELGALLGETSLAYEEMDQSVSRGIGTYK